MKARNYDQWRGTVLQRDNYMCIDCGTTKNLIAHHIKPQEKFKELRLEIDNGLTLCSQCHAKHHKQSYWENISAASLAGKIGSWANVIIRRANSLAITKGSILSQQDKQNLLARPPVRHWHKAHNYLSIPKNLRFYWPPNLLEAGYSGELEIREGACTLVIPKPSTSNKDIAKDLKLLSQQFEHKAEITERG